MKKLFTLALCAAFAITGYSQTAVATQQSSDDALMSKRDAVLSVIHSRKSVRTFVKDKPVSKEDLTTLIKAGMAAPTAVDKRPWHFIVVNDRQKLDTMAEVLPYAKMLKDVSAAILVCGDDSVELGGMKFWMFDCSNASENILLAAEAMGLGAVWTAVYPDQKRMDGVRGVLNIPEHIIPLNVIPVGYPTGKEQPKDKYDESKIHWNGWE